MTTDLTITYELSSGNETVKATETGVAFMNATKKEGKVSVVSSINDITSYVNVNDTAFVKSDVRNNGLFTVTMDTASRVANITAQDNNTVEPVTCVEKDATVVKIDQALKSITVVKNNDSQSVINGLTSYLHDIYMPSEQNVCLSASMSDNNMRMRSVTNLKSCVITTNSEFDIRGFRPRIKSINSVLTKSNYSDAGTGYKLSVTGGGKEPVKISTDKRSFNIKTSMRSNSGEMVYGAVIEDNADGDVTNIAIEYERFDHGECGDVNILHYYNNDDGIVYSILLTEQQIIFYPGRYVSASEGVPTYPDMIRLAFVRTNECVVPRADKLVAKRIILGDEIDATRLKKWLVEGIESIEYNRFGNIPGCIDRVKDFGTDTLCAIMSHLIPDANKYGNKALFDALSSGAFELLYAMLRFDYLNYNDEMANRDFETEIIHYIIKSKINHNVLDHAQIMSRNLKNTFYAPRKGNSVKFVDKPI